MKTPEVKQNLPKESNTIPAGGASTRVNRKQGILYRGLILARRPPNLGYAEELKP
jgi:hypothetical protein